MSGLTAGQIAGLVAPYVGDAAVPEGMYDGLAAYLGLLLRWNGRTNLTAIREPEEIARRHFGESLLLGRSMGPVLGEDATVLDLGSGAGFPGVPVQMLCPWLRVTLAESQGKKASFLREVVRTLGLGAAVWAGRAEELGGGFDAVVLRAVDNPEAALATAGTLVRAGGLLGLLGVEADRGAVQGELVVERAVPGSGQRRLLVWRVG